MSDSDRVLRTLAYQRGVLSLLKDAGTNDPSVERAIEDIDSLIEGFVSASIR